MALQAKVTQVNTQSTNPQTAEFQAMAVELARLKAENERLKASTAKSIRYGVSTNGLINILGLRRFPIGLYVEEYEAIIRDLENGKAFIESHNPQLKRR